ncbi:MAG: DUF4402 domain-containing protein [Alphaproteobacteria bacterium]|jgi:hypothetical protein|nr:DUF4402 domain-containing protein [Alphaproteobacteria bacterium]
MKKKLLTILLVFFVALSIGNKSYSRSSAYKISDLDFGNVIPSSPTKFTIDMDGLSSNPIVILGDVLLGGNPYSGGVSIDSSVGGIRYKYPKNVTLKSNGSSLDVELSVTEYGDPDYYLDLYIGGKVISASPGIEAGTYRKTIKIRYRDRNDRKWKKQKLKIKVVVKEIAIGIEVEDADIDVGTILLEDDNGVIVGVNLDGTSTVMSGNATIMGTPKKGRVRLRGQPNKSIIFVRRKSQLTNSSGKKIDMETVLDSDTDNIGIDGYLDRDIGAIITIPAGVEPGNYSGNFSFDVNY